MSWKANVHTEKNIGIHPVSFCPGIKSHVDIRTVDVYSKSEDNCMICNQDDTKIFGEIRRSCI